MSSAKMDCVRFVRQVSNGHARSKYSYLAMQRDLLAALKLSDWHLSAVPPSAVTTVVNQVSRTDRVVDKDTGAVTAEPTFTAFLDDAYDAYKQGGDADVTNATMCGYAGMAAYRYTLPSEISQGTEYESVMLTNLHIPVQTARYLRSGLRLVVAVSGSGEDDDKPPLDWDFLRGDKATAGGFSRIAVSTSTPETAIDSVASWGVGGQPSAACLTQSRPQEAAFNATPGTDVNGKRYLWVFVSIEDYTDYWTLYDTKTQRYYSIEGSAAVVAADVTFTFDKTVSDYTPTSSPASKSAGKLGAYPLWPFAQPLTEVVRAAYGSMVFARGVSRMTARTTNLGALHKAFENAPTKFMFATESNDTTDTYVGDEALPSEMGHIASMRLSAARAGGLFWQAAVGTPFSNVTATDTEGTVTLHSIYQNSRVTVGYGAVVVPASQFITRFTGGILLDADLEDATLPSVYAAGGDFSVLAWRTRSPAALNYLAHVAIAALASKRAFFTGEASQISASFTGDTPCTASMEISAEADLVGVGRLLRDNYVGVDPPSPTVMGPLQIDLEKPVFPGEVIILVPRCDAIRTIDTDSYFGLLPFSENLLSNFSLDGWRPLVTFF